MLLLLRRPGLSPNLTPIESYSARVAAELRAFAGYEVVNELPAIHSLWVQRFVVPLLAAEGVGSIDELWDREVAAQCLRRSPKPARLVGLGAGNGEIELPLAARLAERGITNLELVLLELNPVMIERALASAQSLGLAERIRIEQADLNTWIAGERADVYLASHTLHHVAELEYLYDQVARSLHPEGVLLVNDMIGRNGHVRWPEASEIVRRIWRLAPERYRYNHSLQQVDEQYPDLDCSTVGFEGVRAQDVLPALLDRLHPEVFVPFGNVIDPFVDCVYGPNFDADDLDDAFFIDAVARLDEAAIDLGVLTPTHLVASFRPRPVTCRHPRGRSPGRSVRKPNAGASSAISGNGASDTAGATADSLPGVGSSPDPPARAASLDTIALEADADAARARYLELRSRKAVRIALAVADLRHRGSRLRRRGRGPL